MDKFDELLAKVDAMRDTLKENEFRIEKALETVRELQAELLQNEIMDYLNDESI